MVEDISFWRIATIFDIRVPGRYKKRKKSTLFTITCKLIEADIMVPSLVQLTQDS